VTKAKNIKDIAKLANVSAATVSRVINQNGRYSKETEQRVKRIIKEHNYIPNMSAKGLRTNQTFVIGVIVPDITNNHFASLVLKLETGLFKHGYSCLICNTNESRELEQKHMKSLSAQNVSGIIVISGMQDYPELNDLPIVYVDRPSKDMRSNRAMIESDNERGGYLATEELIKAGCKQIAILKCLYNDPNQVLRYEGFKRALAAYGIAEDTPLSEDLSEVSFDAAYNKVKSLLDRKANFDSLMCTTDTLAAGAVIALRENGLEVPRDKLVTGFDDCQIAEVCGPGITSVHQDVDEMAKLATRLLLDMINKKELDQLYYKLPVSLTIRSSTTKL